MRKIYAAMVFGLLAYTPLMATAAPSTGGIDQDLMSNGVIGSDYKYKDIEAANRFFAGVYESVNASLPAATSDITEATSLSISPYYSEYTHRYTFDIPAEKLPALTAGLSSPRMLKKLCQESYLTEKFLSANNHTMIFTYIQKNGDKIADIIMSRSTCK